MSSCVKTFNIDKVFESYSTETDILGRPAKQNPFVNEKEALELLGGIKNREDFEDALQNSDLDYLKDKGEEIFEEFSSYTRVPIREVVEGSIVDKVITNRQYLEEVLTEPTNGEIVKMLDFLLELSPLVTQNNAESVQKIIDETLDSTIDIGLDLSMERGKSLDEVKPILQAVADFIEFSDEASFNNLVSEYDRISPSLNSNTTLVKLPLDNDFMFYMETNQDEYSLYETNNIIKVDENVYMEVSQQPLEEIYQGLLSNLKALPTSILPQKEQPNIINIVEQKVKIEDLKNYVTEKAKSVERTPLTNVETLQKIIATKMFFELPITVQPEIPTIREKLNTYLNPTNNYDYLVTDFIADFNKEKIREGRKNSRKYKDYYSNFEINEKGIILKNSDPITVKLMESYISEDMKNYLSSTDQIQLEVYDDMITRELKREYYLEYPKALPIFEGNYNPINQNTISSKESMDFLRLPDNRVFEQTDSIEDTFFYSNVTDKEQPKLDIEKRDYENLQPTASVTNIKNLYTKAVEQEIDKELECK